MEEYLMPYQYSEFPDFNYSFSRLKTLTECKRKYFLNYYLSHNGWLREVANSKKQAYKLKCLQNIYSITGSAIHSNIKKIILNDTTLKDSRSLQKAIAQEIKNYYKNSKQNIEQFALYPKKYPTLHEIYYHCDIQDDTKDKINNTVIQCSKNVFENETIMGLHDKNLEILEVDELKSFDFAGLFNCYLKIDLLCRDSNGNYYIFDWKTSGHYNSDHAGQLLLYTYYVAKVYGVSADRVESQLIYLHSNNNLSFVYDDGDMNALEYRFFRDFEIMKEFIIDGTVNTPVTDDKFIQTSNKKCCNNYNFREMCQLSIS